MNKRDFPITSPIPNKGTEEGNFIVMFNDDIARSWQTLADAEQVAKEQAEASGRSTLVYRLVGGYEAHAQVTVKKF